MTNKLVAIINNLKVPKIKKILLYEMKFLVPNYSCLQNPWLGGYLPQIPVLPVLCLQLNLLKPPPSPNKIPGYATAQMYQLTNISQRARLKARINKSMLTIRIQIKRTSSTKKDKRTKTNIRHQDQETKLLNKPISPRRLRERWAAILQALKRNHHIANLGIKLTKPLLTKRLRLPKRSWEILQRQTRPEHNPWATIKAKDLQIYIYRSFATRVSQLKKIGIFELLV